MSIKMDFLAANMILDNLKQKFTKVKHSEDFEAFQAMDERMYDLTCHSKAAHNLFSAAVGRWRTVKLPRLNNTDKVWFFCLNRGEESRASELQKLTENNKLEYIITYNIGEGKERGRGLSETEILKFRNYKLPKFTIDCEIESGVTPE